MPADNAINASLPTKPNSASRYNQSLYNKRRLTNKLGLGFAMSAMVFGLFWLFWILLTLFVEGFHVLCSCLFLLLIHRHR